MSFSRRKNKRGSLAKQLSSLFPSKNPFVNVDQIAIITKRYSLIMHLTALRTLFFFFLSFFTFSIYGVAQTASVDIGRVYYTDSVHNESNKLMPVKRKSSSYFSSNSKKTVSSRLGNYFLSDFNNLAAQTIFEHSDWKKKYAKNNNNVLRDKDSLRLSIDRFEEIDSVKWYLYIGSENKEICSKGNDAGYTFVVTAENFDCLFSRSGRNNNILVQGGSSWDYAVWSSDDSCHFEAEVFIHKDEEAFIKRLKSKSYALRVLPTEPVTEVLRTWAEDEDKLNPFAKIRIDNLSDSLVST